MRRSLPFVLLSLLGVAWLASCPDDEDAATGAAARYAGTASCAECHPAETAAWRGSHHDLALQEATPETVLGDFEAADFEHAGERTAFARRGDRFFFEAVGPDGERGEFEVAYTFGVEPLQQYLVALSGGRYQALNVAWDARPKAQGGQRWFHLHPEETALDPANPLHWTAPLANWNRQCADCHSTALAKNWNRDAGTYATSWEEPDVSCEACHGPALRHVAQAESGGSFDPAFGFARRLPGNGGWILDPGPTARRIGGPDPAPQIDACAPCHARRGELVEVPGEDEGFLDAFRPALLDERLYHHDGQIEDEVYVWGSFLQSRMHAAGVACTDCHDPHSLDPILPGNRLCTRCHDADVYDAPEHHHHEEGTPGASCVECHMPAKTYMVVDPRRDHSLRVPRPDLTVSIGVPNACNACHADESAEWAAAAIDEWTGGKRPPHRGEAFHAWRRGEPGGAAAVAKIVRDTLRPAIVRATALAEQGMRPTPHSADLVASGLEDPSALVVIGALGSANLLEPGRRAALCVPLLEHERRGVRIEAARALLDLHDELDPDARAAWDRAHAERLAALDHESDASWALRDLARTQHVLGDAEAAEATYREAVALEPWIAENHANYADLLRELGRDEEGARILRAGLEVAVDRAPLLHALGLNLVRRERLVDAVSKLREAAELRPDVARYAYVHAVALEAFGRPEGAIDALAAALERHPWDSDLLNAQVSLLMRQGRQAEARPYVERLLERNPDDADARAFLEEDR